jgi:hypothetical protein
MVGEWMQDSGGDSVKELLTSASKAVRMTPLSEGGRKRDGIDYPACPVLGTARQLSVTNAGTRFSHMEG